MGKLNIEVLTLFPAMFDGVLGESILKRAQQAGALDVTLTNFRDYALDKHKSVDDSPYGGSPGMVLKCEPVIAAIRDGARRRAAKAAENPEAGGAGAGSVQAEPHMVMLTPQGATFTQAKARELSSKQDIVMLCGRYEGFDERIREAYEWDEISIGDYVLTGGELAAMVVIDAVARLLPGVLGDAESAADDSFEDGLLEYPHYTRPPDFEGMTVPDILLSGHHKEIEKWRRAQAEARTQERRPDLWERYTRGK